MGIVREIGSRRPREPGLRWPTPAETAFIDRPLRKVMLRSPCRVRRYATHEEADADLRRLLDEEAARTPLFKALPLGHRGD